MYESLHHMIAGYEDARAAIASAYTVPEAPLTPADVIIASGCSGALDLVITAIADEGTGGYITVVAIIGIGQLPSIAFSDHSTGTAHGNEDFVLECPNPPNCPLF
jgi:N-acetylmuramic acid 6-phosphate (MurNAc-6-P) etherase